MEELIATFARAHGKMPGACDVGHQVNTVLEDSALCAEPSSLMGFLERLTEDHDCLRYGSCLECPLGLDLLSEAIRTDLNVPLDSTVLRVVVRPWVSSAPSGEMRVFATDCDIGDGINRWGEEFAQLRGEACLEYNSCAECPRGVEAVAGTLLELLEEGWEGETGRRLRAGAGFL